MPVPKGYVIDPPATPAHIPEGYVLDGSNDISRPAGVPDGVTLGSPEAHPATNMQSAVTPGLVGSRLLQNASGLIKPLLSPAKSVMSYPGFVDPSKLGGPIQDITQNPDKGEGAANAIADTGFGLAIPKLVSGAARLAGNTANAGGFLSKLATATPEAQKIAATRALVPGSPAEMLTRALKPPVTSSDFEQSVEGSLPTIASQNPKGVKGFADAAATGKTAANDWYQKLKSPYANSSIDASPITNAQLNSIPITNQIETPNIFDKTATKANNFKAPMPLDTLDQVRQDTNAKLQAFYNKSGGDRYAALSDPETARTKATNDTARDLVYDSLSSQSGIPKSDIEANQNLYGKLSDVSDVAGRRSTVAGRANPMSLQETLALKPSPMGVIDYAGQRLFKGLTDSDALTNAALDRYRSPDTVSLPSRPGLFAKAGSALGGGLQAVGSPLRGINPEPVTSLLFAPKKRL